jgi:hypothetical protein
LGPARAGPAPAARPTTASFAELLAAEFTYLFTFFIAELAVFVFVETLKHPLVHLFAIRSTYALSRRWFVGRLFSFFIRTHNAC